MMEAYLFWAAIGIALVIAELLTGTFYLLVIAIAAFAGAAAAYLGLSFWVQAVSTAVVVVIGVILVGRIRAGAPAKGGRPESGHRTYRNSRLLGQRS
jgi:membrane protein implicated in regulation of membrane protease activity